MVFKRSYVIRTEYRKLHLFAYLKLKDYDGVQLFVLSTFPIFMFIWKALIEILKTFP